jgi:gluconokinase
VPSEVVIGVDVGTTSTKAVAFDATGATWGDAAAGYPLDEPAPGRAEQDPQAILRAVLSATREAATEARRRGADVAGLGFSAALHSLIAVGADDRPLTPSITWADSRAAEQAARLRADHPELHQRTGTPLHPMAPLPKLVWFRERDPETFDAARRWVGIKELVLAHLTGAWVVDHSIASATGLLELATLGWDREALEVAGVSADQLSELVPTTHRVGELRPDVARELGLDPATPVIIGGGDGPLANLGLGAVRPGVAACSIGTSGALRVAVQRPGVDPGGRIFCYALTERRWTVGGAINNGGVVLEWAGEALAPDLGAHHEARLLELAASAPAGSDGLVMLPYLLGERAPHWQAGARGAYVGLTHRHRREHLIRAAIEGVCLQLALVLDSVRAAGNEVHEVRATGGFARSDFWRQLLADVLGQPVGFAEGREGSSFGAALLAMQALGLVADVDVAADLVRIEQVHDPDPEATEVYAATRPTFDALYDAIAPAVRDLSGGGMRGASPPG